MACDWRDESLRGCGQLQTAVYERAGKISSMGKPRGMFNMLCRWSIPPELRVLEMFSSSARKLLIQDWNVKVFFPLFDHCVKILHATFSHLLGLNVFGIVIPAKTVWLDSHLFNSGRLPNHHSLFPPLTRCIPRKKAILFSRVFVLESLLTS
jgi:hypothetical protein